MSIYATLWTLQFPKYGDVYIGCEWIQVRAQGVPPHIGTPTVGQGYEAGNPYGDFLPPPVDTDSNGEAEFMRAVVIVTENTEKGTPRNGQEYIAPLLTLTGREYAAMTFAALYERICDALRAGGPRVTIQTLSPSGRRRIHFEDGSIRDV
jgi:hypothetical protein